MGTNCRGLSLFVAWRYSGQAKNQKFDRRAKISAGHSRHTPDKRILIKRHVTKMPTLGCMINEVIELGAQKIDIELDPKKHQ